MYLIDTNIFLEVLPARQNKDGCLSLLRKIEDNEVKAVATSFTIHSIEVIMANSGKLKELGVFLGNIKELKGLSIYYTTIAEEREALEIIEREGLDFDDAVQAYVANRLEAAVISFDKHFDKVEGLKRLRPEEAIGR